MENSAILLYSANKLADHIYCIKKGGLTIAALFDFL